MNFPYAINRSWSDRFIPEIQRIVGAHLLSIAPDAFDMHEATDLLMMEAKDLHIAARVRRPGYARVYPYDFTIRAQVPSGAETELSKIVNGKGDWMFYGHADASGRGLASWWLIDLRAFRAGLIRQATNGYPIRCGDRTNPDGTRFKWFDIRSFPPEPPLVVASGHRA
ncbi:hypothetical protein P1J78_16345 [Psychromarinibacter sp. C21-152]|uniref:Uncharacterized protein n=1 Tax=Psychromarinibacter sediminicola TaxID=3033385 RepID=A0AAE3NUM0_9RHOB|nr:hypothetical protein [Psychromarinibacter sediminicola]MDF0602311.1 hypothetical protein [Psychromarinibacter sediminicola]